jgi:single-stranded-DNA-specific exonuclease
VGGHPQAAGFSIDDTKKTQFLQAVEDHAKNLPTYPDKELFVDLELPFSAISLPLAEEIQKLEPYGIGNPHPLFTSTVLIKKKTSMGKTNQHLQLFITDSDDTSITHEAVFFNPSDEQKKLLETSSSLKIVYTLELNEWRGVRKPVCQIKMVV